MDENQSGGSAFPIVVSRDTDPNQATFVYGMTKHEWFAGQALDGLLASPRGVSGLNIDSDPDEILQKNTARALQYADAMIEAYKKREEGKS